MRIFTLVFMILGCFLGAGFVSGKEIATYFSVFGQASILGIILATIFFFLLILFFLFLSNKTHNLLDFFKKYFGNFSGVINFLFAICLLILISSMYAGAMEIANFVSVNKYIMLIFTSIFAFVVLSFNVKGMNIINNIFVPIILVVIILNCFLPYLIKFEYSGNYFLSSLYSMNYVSINMVTLGLFILEIGHKYTLKEKIISAIICSIIIGFFMILINNAIVSYHLENTNMPILLMSIAKSKYLWWLSIVTVWIGLFTTLISCAHLLVNYIKVFINSKYLSILLSLFMGTSISLFGFEIMVGYVYSIIGIIGAIVLCRVGIKEKRTFILKVRK